ncbi:nuclear transport factor 2 family protein [Rhizobium sp. LjRoot30]|uniref:YybH family protein n=1 Tax=Rhizobium sp. LjRoot30 TaxID=3342320 RepID=UPI003ECFD400
MSDHYDVLDVIRNQDAATARGDAAAVVAPIDDGAILFDLPPPLQNQGNPAEGIEGLNAWFEMWEGGVTITLDNPTVIVDGDLAVVFGLNRMQGVKKDGGPLDAWNRRTVVLHRRNGQWKIIHEHNSYPMAMDGTARAMTELKPE